MQVGTKYFGLPIDPIETTSLTYWEFHTFKYLPTFAFWPKLIQYSNHLLVLTLDRITILFAFRTLKITFNIPTAMCSLISLARQVFILITGIKIASGVSFNVDVMKIYMLVTTQADSRYCGIP